jgi:glutathione S-transferase
MAYAANWLLTCSETVHQRAALRELDDDPHLLRDLGLSREEALELASRPFGADEAFEATGAEQMSDPIVYGFPRSTFVNIVRLILTHKDVPYVFHDLESVMGKAEHLALHPFNRVPIFRHGDFTVYETSAIATYIDEAFDGPSLTPREVRARARMNQWISAVNSYYYPYMIFHVTHERLVFPELGIASDEKVVAHALPKVELGLRVIERELVHGKDYILGSELTLADYYLLPCTFAFGLADEGKAMYPKFPAFCRWRERMENLPTTRKLRAILPPREPIAHAREWAVSHRAKY